MNARRAIPVSIVVWLLVITIGIAAQAQGQGRGNPNPLRMLTKTIYTARTEFFAVYRPYVVGQDGRLTAHMSNITDRFEAYPENSQLTLTLAVGGATIQKSKPDAIEVVTIGAEKMPRK